MKKSVHDSHGFSAIDARIQFKPAETPISPHQVNSAYPDQYEEHATTNTGIDIFIRPIRPEDAPLYVDLFESLSPRSIYMRFFNHLKQLTQSMLARFTQIDYDREIALVALPESGLEEKMLGVARVITEHKRKHAEFSVVVADPWQGKGIGAELLRRCLVIAKEQKIEKVWGVALIENTQMLALGKKLGFKFKKLEGTNEYELTMELCQN